MSQSSSYDVIVLGASLDALAGATRLAQKGRRVLVCDNATKPGGLARSDFPVGNKFSTSAWHDISGLWPRLVDNLELHKYGLEYSPTCPDVLLLNPDGPGVVLTSDLEKVSQQLLQISASDSEGYQRFNRFIDKVRPLICHLVFNDLPDLEHLGLFETLRLGRAGLSARLLGKKTMYDLLRILPMCAADWLDEYFESDFIKGSMALPAMWGNFVGPRSPGTSTNLLFHECLRRGSVRGGVGPLVDSLYRAAQAHGVEFRWGLQVGDIGVQDNRVTDIGLEDGQRIKCKALLSSLDPRQTFTKLLNERHLDSRFVARMSHYRGEGVVARLNLHLNKEIVFKSAPETRVAYARAAPSLDHVERAFDAVKYGEFSSEPALDIYLPSVDDPSLVSKGEEIVSMWVYYAPYELREGWGDSQRQNVVDNALQVLERYAPGVRDTIMSEQLLLPEDLERDFGAVKGHVAGGDLGIDQLLSRPVPECARYKSPIKGLSICGGGSHPGSFSPGASGLKAANTLNF
jgi:phytoene dehydrogenase-like protein